MSKVTTSRDLQLRQAFSEAIKQLLRSQVPAAKIAGRIGVRRQTVYLYRDKKITPSGSVVHRLCEEWNLTLDIAGFRFGAAAFAEAPKSAAHGEQLTFAQYLERLSAENFEIKVLGRKGDTFRIELSIRPAKSA